MGRVVLDLLEKLWKVVRECEIELNKLIGYKSKYPPITLNERYLYHHGWIKFHLAQEPTGEEYEEMIKILEKYFGELIMPRLIKNYKTERDYRGELRYNNYTFFAYTKAEHLPPLTEEDIAMAKEAGG
jgi:hypothetical protein